MQKRVRAVIIKGGKLLVIKRVKNNETYFVLPGGGVDNGEDDGSALTRECLEEVNVNVVVSDLIFKQVFNQNEELFYLCDMVSGTVGRGDGEEYKKMTDSNSYKPTWWPLDNISGDNIRPTEITDILKSLKLK